MKKSTLTALIVGQTLLMSARKVNGGKVQLELAEVIANPTRNNALADLNADDDRFSGTSKARRCYATASPAIVDKAFGIDTASLKEGESMEDINVLNPELNGKRLRVEIVESSIATEWDQANLAKAAKQYTNSKGETKYFVKDGKFIFSKPGVTNGEPKHNILQSDIQLSMEEAEAAGITFDVKAVVAEGTKVLNK